MKRTLTIAALLAALAACGNGDNNVNSTTDTTTANNTTANNTTANNTTANNTTATNNTIVDCGAVTFEGECSDATTVLYCDDDFGLVEVDCTENFGATATCVDVPDYGADCGIAAGEQCEFYDEVEDSYSYQFCSGNTPACVWMGGEDVTCVDDFGVCDEATFAPSCEGTVFAYECYYTQPLAADCAALGGTCDAATGCVMPAGSDCDEVVTFCAAGLQCTIPSGETVGTCG